MYTTPSEYSLNTKGPAPSGSVVLDFTMERSPFGNPNLLFS